MPDRLIYDAVPITSRIKTPEGFLSVQAAVTRTGIVEYDAAQLGLTDRTGPVKVMRTPESVFHKETIASVRDAVVTKEHPAEFVDSGNWKSVAVGNATGIPSPLDDGYRLGAGLIIRDQDAIDALDSGKDELSIGYKMNLIPVQSSAYDYKTDGPMPVNHIAMTDMGRAGPEVKVFDKGEEMPELTDEMKAAITAAVKDALPKPSTDPAQPVQAQAVDSDKIAAAIMGGMKPVLDSIETASKAMIEAEQQKAQDDAKAKAQDAANKLIQDTLAVERGRVSILDEARPFLTAEQLDSLKESPTKDILLAAVGNSVPNAAAMDEAVLRGVLMGLGTQQNQSRQMVTDARAQTGITGQIVQKGTAYDSYVKSIEEGYKQNLNGLNN